MKIIAFFIFSLIALLLTPSLHAQDDPFSLEISAGLTFPILSSGKGIYLGVQPVYRITRVLALEAQAAYTSTRISSGFLGGSSGREQSAGAFLGLRLYLVGADRPFKMYLNLLGGPSYFYEYRDRDGNTIEEVDFTMGTGLFAQFGAGFAGVSTAGFGLLALRGGYIF